MRRELVIGDKVYFVISDLICNLEEKLKIGYCVYDGSQFNTLLLIIFIWFIIISYYNNYGVPGNLTIVNNIPIIAAIVEAIVPNLVATSSNFFSIDSLVKKCSVSLIFKSSDKLLIVLNLSSSSNANDNLFITWFLSIDITA